MARTKKMTTQRHQLTDLNSPDNEEGKTKVLLPEALGTMVERNIQYRAPAMFRVQVRLRGIRDQNVVDTLEGAIAWRDQAEKAITGEGYIDTSLPARTTLKEACEWAINRLKGVPPNKRKANDKNLLSKWLWWAEESPFRGQKLNKITDRALIRWRTKLLNEDAGDDVADSLAGEEEANLIEGRKVGAQTVIHRLNALSRLFDDWRIANDLAPEQLPNPVGKRVRPKKPGGRTRRLVAGEEERLLEAADAARPWLRYAVILAIETAMRQTELARLTWNRVSLDDNDPHAYLPETETKSCMARTVPLSPRAIETLVTLRDVVRPAMLEAWNNREQKTEGAEFRWDEGKVLPPETGRGIIHAYREALEAAQEKDEAVCASINQTFDLVVHPLGDVVLRPTTCVGQHQHSA